MSRNTDVHGSLSFQITINPNTVTQIPAFSGQLAQQIKLVSGTTCAIGGSTQTQAALVSGYAFPGTSLTLAALPGGATFSGMYVLSASEIFSWNNAGPLYLWNGGATTTVAIFNGRSQGAPSL